MTLTDFLLARIGEDEAEARLVSGDAEPMPLAEGLWAGDESVMIATPARVLAECDAKRRIVTDFLRYEAANGLPQVEGARRGLGMALKALALAYGDHPDWLAEWRP